MAGSFTSLLVVAVVLGMCDGTVFCMYGPIAFDLVGPVDSAQALGFVFGLLALPASLGPPLAGLLYDHYGNYNLAFHVAGIPLFVGAAIMVFIPHRFTSLLVVAVVLGMCDGTVFCMVGPVAFDLVGPVDSAQVLGFVFGLVALPASLGPPLAGFLYDHFGNYNLAFHVSGVPLMVGAAMMVFVPKR
nr:hypothetical protein BaRGS_020539 [Batillaria attramentaria]